MSSEKIRCNLLHNKTTMKFRSPYLPDFRPEYSHSAPIHPSIVATTPTRDAVEKDSCQTIELLPKFIALRPTKIIANNYESTSIVRSLPPTRPSSSIVNWNDITTYSYTPSNSRLRRNVSIPRNDDVKLLRTICATTKQYILLCPTSSALHTSIRRHPIRLYRVHYHRRDTVVYVRC